MSTAELASLRAAIQGKEASSFESIRRDVPVAAAAMAGLNMAMLDVVGKHTRAPVYLVLSGPTRNKARALARIDGETDDAIVAVWSKYSHERSELMMDVPHARQQLGSAVGVRHRGGQSETLAPE